VTDRLTTEFAGVFSRETVAETVSNSHDALGTYKVANYMPLLVHRFARDRLHACGVVEGRIAKERPEVLFVCVQNAGRSQMAAALLHHHAADRVLVRSAGSAPTEQVNPLVVQALTEVGIDASQEFPKPLTTESVQASDVVVTMGCGDACPVFPGKRYLDWQLDDPAGQDLDTVRRIRDDIDARVRDLLGHMLSSAANDRSGAGPERAV
jgi:protein-tyrosine-phosphatase